MRAVVALVLTCSSISVCLAQADRLQQNCIYAEGERQVRACTDLINLGEGSPEDRASAYSLRGHAYQRLAKFDLALADFRAAADAAPNNAAYRRQLSNAYSSRGNVVEALRLDPDNGRAMTSQAERLWERAQFEQAIEWYTKALGVRLSQQWQASDRASAFFSRGWLNFIVGNYEAAISDFSDSLKLNPGNAHSIQAWRCLARLLTGQAAAAREDCDKAVERDGNHLDFELRPLVFLMLNRLSEARAKAENVAGQGTDPRRLYLLAIVLEAQGDAAGAQQRFDRARELSKPGNFERYERELQRYRKVRRP